MLPPSTLGSLTHPHLRLWWVCLVGVGAQGSPQCNQKPEQAPALELTVSQRANTPVPVGQHQRAERPS